MESLKVINIKRLLSNRRIGKSPSNERKQQSLIRKCKLDEKDKKKKEPIKR
jgi:hypothetical protein